VHYDFDGAQAKLAECEAVIDADYFLTAIKVGALEGSCFYRGGRLGWIWKGC